MKRVLLTGAGGFIGRNAIVPLLSRGFEVHCVSSRPDSAIADGVWHHTDLLEPSQVAELLDRVRPTHLLHFAWYAAHGKYQTSVENLRWLQATIGLALGFKRVGGTRAVFAGTCFEYDLQYGYCREELTPRRPSTLYGTCKSSTFEAVQGYALQANLSLAWGRIFYLYGPHEAPGRLLPSVILSILSGEAAKCTHGRQLRDFMHVSDVAEAFVELLESPVQGAVNIGSGDCVTIRELVELVVSIIGRGRAEFGAFTAPPGEPPAVLADVSILRDKVGWKPRLDLQRGLEETVEWWKLQAPRG